MIDDRILRDRLAAQSLILYIIYILFFAIKPFPDVNRDVDAVVTSNMANQIFYSAVFVISLFCIVSKRTELKELILQEKYLTLFILWCLLSMSWSAYPFVSFKRWFQLLTCVTVITAFLLNIGSSRKFLSHLEIILFVYIFLSYASIIIFPGAIDPEHLTWRGLAPGKNTLGQIAIVCIITWFNAYTNSSGNKKLLSIIMLLLSLVLLIQSHSMTSMLALFAMIFTALVLRAMRSLKSIGVGGLLFTIVAIMLMVSCVLVVTLKPEITGEIFGALGKQPTFSGRIELWTDILEQVKKHPLIGGGYGSYWVIGNPDLMDLYETHVWLPNQAHMGYLDILNDVGIIGLILFALMVIAYYKRLASYEEPFVWHWFFFTALIINLQETILFYQNMLVGIMFVFSYLTLSYEKSHQKIAYEEQAEVEQTLDLSVNN